jgi:hypothetical protein
MRRSHSAITVRVLPAAGRHHQQRLALLVALERLGDPADGALLVEPLDDVAVDVFGRQRLARLAALDHQRQLVLLEEALDRPRRMPPVVPDPVVVAVRVEDDRPLPVLLLQAVGIELGLLLAGARVLAGALGLDQGERPAVVAAQHVVDIADAGRVRHAGHFNFGCARRLRLEAGLANEQVDEQVAGFGLAVVVGVGDLLVRDLGGGDLGLQRLDFGFECGAAFLAHAPRFFSGLPRRDRLLETAGDLLQLGQRRGGDLRELRQRLDAEGRLGRRLRALRVGAGEPIGDVEELAQAAGGLAGRHLLAVDGGVAGVLHKARLDRESAAEERLEARLGKQRGKRRVVGVVQRGIVP